MWYVTYTYACLDGLLVTRRFALSESFFVCCCVVCFVLHCTHSFTHSLTHSLIHYLLHLLIMASFAETFKALNVDQPDLASSEGAYTPKNIMVTGGAGFM